MAGGSQCAEPVRASSAEAPDRAHERAGERAVLHTELHRPVLHILEIYVGGPGRVVCALEDRERRERE